jgi:hypothetical protein
MTLLYLNACFVMPPLVLWYTSLSLTYGQPSARAPVLTLVNIIFITTLRFLVDVLLLAIHGPSASPWCLDPSLCVSRSITYGLLFELVYCSEPSHTQHRAHLWAKRYVAHTTHVSVSPYTLNQRFDYLFYNHSHHLHIDTSTMCSQSCFFFLGVVG